MGERKGTGAKGRVGAEPRGREPQPTGFEPQDQ